VRGGNELVALNDAAERMTMPVSMLQQHAHLKLLFTGGEGALHTTGEPEAAQAEAFFISLGLPPARMQFEAASRSTYENAINSAKLNGVDKSLPWLLVTSAWHMPRAMATFQKAGWNVTPFPVDFRTGVYTPWFQYSLALGALRWQLALHEWVGLFAYRALGKA